MQNSQTEQLRSENWYARARTWLKIVFSTAGIPCLGRLCSADQGMLCPLEPPFVTRDAAHNINLPEGCRVVGLSDVTAHEIVCDDGRSGFAFE